jgi:hypothetical protein
MFRVLYCFFSGGSRGYMSHDVYLNNSSIFSLFVFLVGHLRTDRYEKWRAPSRTKRRPITSAEQVNITFI